MWASGLVEGLAEEAPSKRTGLPTRHGLHSLRGRGTIRKHQRSTPHCLRRSARQCGRRSVWVDCCPIRPRHPTAQVREAKAGAHQTPAIVAIELELAYGRTAALTIRRYWAEMFALSEQLTGNCWPK